MQELQQPAESQVAQTDLPLVAEQEVDQPSTPSAGGSEGKLQALRLKCEATQVRFLGVSKEASAQ